MAFFFLDLLVRREASGIDKGFCLSLKLGQLGNCLEDKPKVSAVKTQKKAAETMLTTLNVNSDEPISAYFTRADMLRLDLEGAAKKKSDAVFTALVLRGQPAAYDSIQGVSKYKATFVAHDFSQAPGLGHQETYARLATLQTTLVCGVQQGVHFGQMDIQMAY